MTPTATNPDDGRDWLWSVPVFAPPSAVVHASFLRAMDEFQAEGRGAADDDSMVGREIRDNRATWHDPRAFDLYTARLRADADPASPRPDGHVPCTSLWWVEGEDYLGRLAIRHELNQFLLQLGGHIGYDVRPTARRRGHATAMLRAALPIARSLGIDRVLVTCDNDNAGSRHTIENNGGVVLEDERGGKLRYWIDTAR